MAYVPPKPPIRHHVPYSIRVHCAYCGREQPAHHVDQCPGCGSARWERVMTGSPVPPTKPGTR